MRKSIILVVAFFLIASPCFADFKFAVIGDTRDYGRNGINVKVMKAIMEKIKAEKPDFIIVTGDMITGSSKSNVHINRLKKWKWIIERYKIPFYIGIGNHEIESELSENIIRSIFEMPENGPEGFTELIYSFDHRDSHFVMLDTAIFKNFHSIGQEQMRWLEDDLKTNQGKNIFVFGHDPAYPVHDHIGSSLDKYLSQRDDLWAIFKKYKIKAYICGHEHLYNTSIHEGIYQIISGGGGAHISVREEKGGFYNFIVIDVRDNGQINFIVKDIRGIIRDSF